MENKEKLPMNSKLILEYNNYVLAEREYTVGESVRKEYITWSKSITGGYDLGHYFINLQSAQEDFAKRSKLVNPDKLFSDNELALMYSGLLAFHNGARLTDYKTTRDIYILQNKLENLDSVDIDRYNRETVLIIEPDKEPYKKEMVCELYNFKEELGDYVSEIRPIDGENVVLIKGTRAVYDNTPAKKELFGTPINSKVIVVNSEEYGEYYSLSPNQIKEITQQLEANKKSNSYKGKINQIIENQKDAPVTEKKDFER